MGAYYDPQIYSQAELEAELAHWKNEQKKALSAHSADGVSATRISTAEIADRLRAIHAALRHYAPETYGVSKSSTIQLTLP
jgi:hypothetical protein